MAEPKYPGWPFAPPPPPKPPRPPAAPGEGNIGGSGAGSRASGSPRPKPSSQPTVPQYVQIGQAIDAVLQQSQSPLTGLGIVFARQAKKRKMDPLLLPSIMGAESSLGTQMPSGTNNPFGWGPHIQFPSFRAAIRDVTAGLHKGYISQGLDTIPEIQRKWAPVGAGNDPTNLNSNWIKNVSNYYNKFEKAAGTKPKFPINKKTGQTAYIPGMEELIYDPAGYWFGGQFTQEPYGGHEEHAHLGGNNPRLLLNSIRLAQRLGLRVGENPYTDRVDPVHAGQSARYGDYSGTGGPSMHYSTFPGLYGPQNRPLGRAIDVSGDPSALAKFFQNRLMIGGRTYTPFGGGYVGGAGGAGVYGDNTSSVVADRNEAEWEQAQAARGNALFGAAFEDAPMGPRRRRKRDNPYIDDLLNRLGGRV
jgi:hypothetical protein